MLAPNPNTPRPTRRQPWETPELPPADHMPYGHRVACEVAAREIRKAMDAAAAVLAANPPRVYADDVPFANCSDAARFMAATVEPDRNERAMAQGILRACQTGKPYCGIRWRWA